MGNRNTLQQESLRSFYLDALDLVVQGAYTAASDALRDLRELETHDAEREAIRKLISARISIKKGMSQDDLGWIEMEFPQIPWIAPEANFVLGLNEFHRGRFKEGLAYFEKARDAFAKLGLHDRELLSAFNAVAGRMAADLVVAPSEKLAELQALEAKTRECGHRGCEKVLAMVLRQKSHIFEEEGRVHSALEEITGAVRIFEKLGPTSDFHMALLSAADLCLQTGDAGRARIFFEYILPPFDQRVEFPYAYVHWRLGGPLPAVDAFGPLPGGWKEKFERHRDGARSVAPVEWVWKIKEGKIGPEGSETHTLKAESVEGKFIRLLCQGRASKHFLIEALWPESGSAQHLDNRLHRMVSRANQKLGKVITFDGQYYNLSVNVRIC